MLQFYKNYTEELAKIAESELENYITGQTETSNLYRTGHGLMYRGKRLKDLPAVFKLQAWGKINIPAPAPVQYNYQIRQRHQTWDQAPKQLLSFHTRTEAVAFAQNLANLFNSEVRMDTGGSGTYITPKGWL